MPKKESDQSRLPDAALPAGLDRFALERRRFLAEGAFYGGGLLASLGLSRYAMAQPPQAGGEGGRPTMRPPLPPEPKVSQPAPLKELKGKVAYITASSDGIGLGIARAASLAGMKVCIGYRNEERLKAALPLFKPGNAGVLPVKQYSPDTAVPGAVNGAAARGSPPLGAAKLA